MHEKWTIHSGSTWIYLRRAKQAHFAFVLEKLQLLFSPKLARTGDQTVSLHMYIGRLSQHNNNAPTQHFLTTAPATAHNRIKKSDKSVRCHGIHTCLPWLLGCAALVLWLAVASLPWLLPGASAMRTSTAGYATRAETR